MRKYALRGGSYTRLGQKVGCKLSGVYSKYNIYVYIYIIYYIHIFDALPQFRGYYQQRQSGGGGWQRAAAATCVLINNNCSAARRPLNALNTYLYTVTVATFVTLMPIFVACTFACEILPNILLQYAYLVII